MAASGVSEQVTVTELNQQTAAVLHRVKQGQALVITERGRVVAYLAPPPPSITGNPVVDRWVAEGRLTPQALPGNVTDLLPPPESSAGSPSLADAIIAERDREPDDG